MTGSRVVGGSYLERLGERTGRTRTCLCVGIDPDLSAIPDGFPASLVGLERFVTLLLEAALPHAAAVKVNLAFFEAWGGDGIHALDRIRSRIPDDVPFIADAKRGDIGSTSRQHAAALFDRLGADAITASPYLGREAIEPLLERPERFVYLLCRTSNPGAGELQDLEVAADPAQHAPAEPLALRVARIAEGWERHPGTIGLVVGATAPTELERIRATAPRLAFLVPGVGTQGGDSTTALRAGPVTEGPASSRPGGALLINVSRGITGAAMGASDPGAALESAARTWARTLQVLG